MVSVACAEDVSDVRIFAADVSDVGTAPVMSVRV